MVTIQASRPSSTLDRQVTQDEAVHSGLVRRQCLNVVGMDSTFPSVSWVVRYHGRNKPAGCCEGFTVTNLLRSDLRHPDGVHHPER